MQNEDFAYKLEVDVLDVVFFITISNNDDILKVIIVFDFRSEGSRGSAIGPDGNSMSRLNL